MPVEEDSHEKLLGSAVLLVIGIIVLVTGLTQLSWVTALFGGALAAVGGFEVRNFYIRIQYENKSIQARQSGTGNVQTSQLNPTNSPVIHAQEVYFGATQPKAQRQKAARGSMGNPVETEPTAHEWLVNGEIRFQDYEEFAAKLSRGDQLKGPVKSEEPISVKIMDDENFEAFEDNDDEDNYDTLWESPATTDYYVSYTATAKRPIHVVIRDEFEEEYKEDEKASAVARIEVIRGGLESSAHVTSGIS